MPQAARMGDMTSHGTPLSPGSGSLNVLISGLPAWRVSIDQHTCPLSSGSTPHIGGTVVLGSSTVFINGVSAVRVGDQVIENGGVINTIMIGANSVFIG